MDGSENTRTIRFPLVGTNMDPLLLDVGLRGADIIDATGGIVFIADKDIPRVIARLACHLSDEDVALLPERPISSQYDLSVLEQALADTDERIDDLDMRRRVLANALDALRQNNRSEEAIAVSYVNFAEIFEPDV